MNKWVGLVALTLLVLAIGYFFSQSDLETPEDSADTPPASATDSATEVDNPAVETEAASSDASCPRPTRAGSGSHRAGLLVTYGDGTSQSVCVSFDETISGYQLLVDSGLSVLAQDFGGSLGQALCKISSGSEGSGCDYPSQDCFCDNPPNAWMLFLPDSGQTSWSVSQSGISSTHVGDGDVQAQLWGNETQSPPLCFYADICGD